MTCSHTLMALHIPTPWCAPKRCTTIFSQISQITCAPKMVHSEVKFGSDNCFGHGSSLMTSSLLK